MGKMTLTCLKLAIFILETGHIRQKQLKEMHAVPICTETMMEVWKHTFGSMLSLVK